MAARKPRSKSAFLHRLACVVSALVCFYGVLLALAGRSPAVDRNPVAGRSSQRVPVRTVPSLTVNSMEHSTDAVWEEEEEPETSNAVEEDTVEAQDPHGFDDLLTTIRLSSTSRPQQCIRKCDNKGSVILPGEKCGTKRFNNEMNSSAAAEFTSCVDATIRLRRDLERFLARQTMVSPPEHEGPATRGLVLTAPKAKLHFLYATVKLLRQGVAPNLAVEIIVDAGSLSACRKLFTFERTTCLATSIVPQTRFGYKHLALLTSTFSEVLWLDWDDIPVKDPSYLFDTPEYKATGAILWPDLWGASCDSKVVSNGYVARPGNALYWALGIDYQRAPKFVQEAELGQLVVNKRRHLEPLLLSQFLTEHGVAQMFAYGDKDTFRLSFLALQHAFHFSEIAGMMGSFNSTDLHFTRCYLLHYWKGSPIFLHGKKAAVHRFRRCNLLDQLWMLKFRETEASRTQGHCAAQADEFDTTPLDDVHLTRWPYAKIEIMWGDYAVEGIERMQTLEKGKRADKPHVVTVVKEHARRAKP